MYISSLQSLMLFSPFSPPYISLPYPPPSVLPHFLMSSDLPAGPWGALIRAVSVNLSLLHVLSPPSGQAVACPPSLLLAPLSLPDPHLIPHWSGQGSALTDWLLYLKPIPHTQLTHCSDDGGSKDLWNTGKLLPDYMALQPRRQPSYIWMYSVNNEMWLMQKKIVMSNYSLCIHVETWKKMSMKMTNHNKEFNWISTKYETKSGDTTMFRRTMFV
jgi:hypothetical protein